MKIIVLVFASFLIALPAAAARQSNTPPGTKVEKDAITSGTNSPDIYHFEYKNAEEWGVFTPQEKEQNTPYPLHIEPRVIWPPLPRSE